MSTDHSSELQAGGSVSSEVGWYPCAPPQDTLTFPRDTPTKEPPRIALKHPLFNGKIKFTPTLWWSSSISKERKERCRREMLPGVEVRDLPQSHPLHGEQGLYAIKRFEKFDVIGEYTGRVVGEEVLRGHYLATLEDLPQTESLGVDAENCGNEIRFINSYLNIAFAPNVTMRTTYINTYPHLVVVCTRDIEIDEEILLDYGEAYNKEFLLPKQGGADGAAEIRTEEQTAFLFSSLPRGIGDGGEDDVGWL